MAAAFIEVGQAEQGAAPLRDAFQVMDSDGEHWYEAELRRLQGEILAAQRRRGQCSNIGGSPEPRSAIPAELDEHGGGPLCC